MVGGSHVHPPGIAKQKWGLEENEGEGGGDCFLYHQECTGDERSMSGWQAMGQKRWIGECDHVNSDRLHSAAPCPENSASDDGTPMEVSSIIEETVLSVESSGMVASTQHSHLQDSFALAQPSSPLPGRDSSSSNLPVADDESTVGVSEVVTSAVVKKEDDSSPMEIV